MRRDATPEEVQRYARLRTPGICCIPGCMASTYHHGACPAHREEFFDQRNEGYYDFRLWALHQMGSLFTSDAFAKYEELRALDP